MGEREYWKKDILGTRLLKRVFKHRMFPYLLIILDLFFFVLIIFTGFVGTPVGARNFSVIMAWILWFVLLIAILVPFVGKFWCSICPLPALGEWLQRGFSLSRKRRVPFGLNRKWPSRFRNIWLQNLTFLTITIFLVPLATIPIASAVLFLGLIISILIVMAVFEKRSWCRYACPLGGFISLYSMCSTLELRVKDPEECKKHLHEYQTACQSACPAGISIQEYVGLISQGQYEEALGIIKEQMPFVGVCGYVCHHPCEEECVRGKIVDEPVAIQDLKHFLVNYEMKEGRKKVKPIEKTRKDKAAIIGSGPAGIACAYDLIKKGYPVTVFEASQKPGGILRYGIPRFILPEEIIDYEIDYVKALGVEIKTNTPLDGKELTIPKLKKQGYGAVFLATGLQCSRKLDIPGADLKGVLWGLDFLKDINSRRKVELGKRVLVIGGGNVAIDVARAARRLGAEEVKLACLESRKEMPAFEWEIEAAVEEGISLNPSWGPKRILGEKGKVTGVEFVHCISVFDKKGKFKPIFDEKKNKKTIEADSVIFAIGQSADLSYLPEEIEITPRRTIKVDDVTLQTSMPGVFAGGDIAMLELGNVINAIAMGKEAAISIDRYLSGVSLTADRPSRPEIVPWEPKEREVAKEKRALMPKLSPKDRIKSFVGAKLGYDEKTAVREASRCLTCGCDVVRGNEEGFGCPWMNRPSIHMKRNATCGLCTECVKTCPEDNIAINLRSPGGDDLPRSAAGEGGLDESWKGFIMLGLVIFYTWALIGPYGALKSMAGISGGLGGFALYALSALAVATLVVPAIFALFIFLSKRISGAQSFKKLFTSYSFSLVPLGLFGWIAFVIPLILVNWSYVAVVLSDPFGWGWNLFGTAGVHWSPLVTGLIPFIFTLIVLVGVVFSINTAVKISRRISISEKQAKRSLIPVVLFIMGAAIMLLTVFLGW